MGQKGASFESSFWDRSSNDNVGLVMSFSTRLVISILAGDG